MADAARWPAHTLLDGWAAKSRLRREILADLGVAGQSTWEMDHVQPCIEGGGADPNMTPEQILANLRTLCSTCHRRETAALARRRAAARQDGRRPLFAELEKQP